MVKKVYDLDDQVKLLSQVVFGALELLMSDCVLATEPSTTAILVTNNLFRSVRRFRFIDLLVVHRCYVLQVLTKIDSGKSCGDILNMKE